MSRERKPTKDPELIKDISSAQADSSAVSEESVSQISQPTYGQKVLENQHIPKLKTKISPEFDAILLRIVGHIYSYILISRDERLKEPVDNSWFLSAEEKRTRDRAKEMNKLFDAEKQFACDVHLNLWKIIEPLLKSGGNENSENLQKNVLRKLQSVFDQANKKLPGVIKHNPLFDRTHQLKDILEEGIEQCGRLLQGASIRSNVKFNENKRLR